MKNKTIKELLEFSIINVDKPSGITSFKTADKVKKILGAKKAGHFGTLDPKVTGVLPIAINRACKLSHYFMKKDKVYIGEMHIHSPVDEKTLRNEMMKFVGKIMQKPPVKSRVKRVLREREVHGFEIISIKKKGRGNLVKFKSDVQAGTYIRKLISDLGENIGGAHMVGLRRIKAGIFEEKDMVTLEKISSAFQSYKNGNEEKLREILIPGEIVKQIITSIQVKEESLERLLNGREIRPEDVKGKLPNSEMFSVFSKDRFIGIYQRIKNMENKEGEEIIAKADFVKN
jgi:H/ACA ribonucleoprotein complex subunit 4